VRRTWEFPGEPDPYEWQPDWKWLGIWFLAACCAFWVILGIRY